MKIAVTLTVILFSTSAMAATFVAPPPVHVAPQIHVNPVVRGNSTVKPVTPKAQGKVHTHPKVLPVVDATTTSTSQKCADQKSGKGCQNR